ncbi:hypothetical protein [Streptomyces mirabilis]|uniref:hypothetical protein n=1 Tax=Streptomyces mirabilis TaxID=68239 RepID=UPI0033E8CF54
MLTQFPRRATGHTNVIRLYAELQDLGYRGVYQRMYSSSMPDIAGSGGSCASTGAWSRTEVVAAVIDGNASVADAVAVLMPRTPKPEQYSA